MNKSTVALVGVFLLAGSGLLLAQDPVKVAPANYKVILENAAVRVLRIDYEAGAKSAMHQHPDAMVIALDASNVKFTMPDKTTADSDLEKESAMYTPAGTHSAVNVGKTKVNAILVEFKGAGGKAALPTSRPNMEIKPLADGARAMAYRSTAAPNFSEPAGTKHDYDQVVIALNAATMSL